MTNAFSFNYFKIINFVISERKDSYIRFTHMYQLSSYIISILIIVFIISTKCLHVISFISERFCISPLNSLSISIIGLSVTTLKLKPGTFLYQHTVRKADVSISTLFTFCSEKNRIF